MREREGSRQGASAVGLKDARLLSNSFLGAGRGPMVFCTLVQSSKRHRATTQVKLGITHHAARIARARIEGTNMHARTMITKTASVVVLGRARAPGGSSSGIAKKPHDVSLAGEITAVPHREPRVMPRWMTREAWVVSCLPAFLPPVLCIVPPGQGTLSASPRRARDRQARVAIWPHSYLV